MIRLFALAVILSANGFAMLSAAAEDIQLTLRHQVETSSGSGRYHRLTRRESWKAEETAIIVCDVWDYHHCLNAVRRLEEFGPRLNAVLTDARHRGMTIIHSPSDCMPAYEGHPARKRAVETPQVRDLPQDIVAWCSRIPSEEVAAYPIDQSDGGEDDDPAEHAQWVAELKALGRNPGLPWQRQSDMITIDSERDFISDRGDEVWNILEHRGIRNVILTGVHTNMCVLGRPFGLRQMARNGRNVVLMRDVTDTMYNPQRWPYVSHFTGTDLIISHVEKFVCPTITSNQFTGGEPIRLKHDTRPHIVIVIAEDEYETAQTLPEFAARHLGQNFRVSFVFGSDQQRNEIPGLEVLNDADLLLVSVRRRLLPVTSMKLVRKFVAAGKPVVGIRTASHAFSLLNVESPPGLTEWSSFDAQVFGGNYSGHHGNKLMSMISPSSKPSSHPILTGIGSEFPQAGSLYKTAPLAHGATALLSGRIDGLPTEPVAWTFKRSDGGRSFYTSLGHPGDFENPSFVRLLVNGLNWAAGLPIDQKSPLLPGDFRDHWSMMRVPSSWESGSNGLLNGYDGVAWYRCVVRTPADWLALDHADGTAGSGPSLVMQPPIAGDQIDVWVNGHKLAGKPSVALTLTSSHDDWNADDANLIVVRLKLTKPGGLTIAPVLHSPLKQALSLKGLWQFRTGDDPSWSEMPLPAKFGGSTDIYFEPLLKDEDQ
jgi:type 1 glutamine amidotransferase/nicotinamidase-related amidase